MKNNLLLELVSKKLTELETLVKHSITISLFPDGSSMFTFQDKHYGCGSLEYLLEVLDSLVEKIENHT